MASGAALSGMAGGDGKKGARAAGNGGGHLCSAGYGRAVGGCGMGKELGFRFFFFFFFFFFSVLVLALYYDRYGQMAD
uniref:Uncharacterized protein OJ1540_H01.17 n=1 Tax=Oryza sativa TaxID=4530 RepID=Q8SB29_ORYSA|nr:hypothetical protein [Oryza sativa Japonica Group]